MRNLLAFIVVATACAAQSGPCKPSARAIFIGEQGALAPTPGCTAAAQQPAAPISDAAKSQSAAPQTPVIPISANSDAMSALMYWIELVRPSGETQRVTSDYVFHSGDRIRLHVASNVPGRLSVAQLTRTGTSEVLFPSSRVKAGDNLVTARAECAIPPTGYFRFDSETGVEQLLVLLTPGHGRSEGQLLAGDTLDQTRTVELARAIQGTRGLILEAVNEPGQAAHYAAAPGPVRIEIRLKHQ